MADSAKWARVSAMTSVAAVLVAVAALVLSFVSASAHEEVEGAKFTRTTAISLNQLCLNWATYVERLHDAGQGATEINRRGRWFSNLAATSTALDIPFSIMDVCGTAQGILRGAGKPPAEHP